MLITKGQPRVATKLSNDHQTHTVSSSEYFYRLNHCINFKAKHCYNFFLMMKILDTDYSADAASQIGNMKMQRQEDKTKTNIWFNSFLNLISIIKINQFVKKRHCYSFFPSPLLSNSVSHCPPDIMESSI